MKYVNAAGSEPPASKSNTLFLTGNTSCPLRNTRRNLSSRLMDVSSSLMYIYASWTGRSLQSGLEPGPVGNHRCSRWNSKGSTGVKDVEDISISNSSSAPSTMRRFKVQLRNKKQSAYTHCFTCVHAQIFILGCTRSTEVLLCIPTNSRGLERRDP